MRNPPPRSTAQLTRTALLVVCLLAACSTPSPEPLPTQTPPPTPTLPSPRSTPTATPQPPGSPANPFGLGFVSETSDPDADNSAQAVAAALSEQTGITIVSQMYPGYDELLDALMDREVLAAWLPPFTYLAAHNRGIADVSLISIHFGSTGYGIQFLANVSTGFTPFYDPGSGTRTAEAETALLQFQDRRPCWVDPRSASGYVIPLGYLNPLGIALKEGVMTQSHAAVVRALYAGGICDFGATYATYGDPRTGEAVQNDLPKVMEQVQIIWTSDPVIPTLALSFSPEVHPDQVIAISNALISYTAGPEGQAALSGANSYEISGLRTADDSLYDPLRGLLDSSGVLLRTLIGR